MSNGKDLDAVGKLLEHHVIRKVVYREPPHGSRHERNPSTSRGESFNQFKSSFNFGDNLANVEVPFPVPRSGLAKIPASGTLN